MFACLVSIPYWEGGQICCHEVASQGHLSRYRYNRLEALASYTEK
jgi:hypothetical protein